MILEREETLAITVHFYLLVEKQVYLEWIKYKVLLYSTGNYIQSPGINHNGKDTEKKNGYMCITESLCSIAGISTTL